MAFPWITEAPFDLGTRGHFDAESDADSRLDFPHYSTLGRIPGAGAPYVGAYCMRVALATSATAAYVQETGSWDMTAGTNDIYLRFYFRLSADLVMADTNEFAIMEFWSATSTAEAGVYINYTTADGFRLGIGKASASSFTPVTLGEWHCIEIFFDPAGGAGGIIDAWLDKSALTQVTGLTNANITSGIVGVVGQDAGTTRGTVLFDEIISDDARIYPLTERWPHEKVMTASGHVFVGHGYVRNVQLLSGSSTDSVATLFDTDVASVLDASNFRSEIKGTVASVLVDPSDQKLRFERGCYLSMAGTAPRVLVSIMSAEAHWSEDRIRNHGFYRKPHPLGV